MEQFLCARNPGACLASILFRNGRGGRCHGEKKIASHSLSWNTIVPFSLLAYRPVLRAQLRKRRLSASSLAASVPFGITRHFVHFIHSVSKCSSHYFRISAFLTKIFYYYLLDSIFLFHAEDLVMST